MGLKSYRSQGFKRVVESQSIAMPKADAKIRRITIEDLPAADRYPEVEYSLPSLTASEDIPSVGAT